MEEWLKEAPLAVLMLVAIMAFLRFLVGERKERQLQNRDCHECQQRLCERYEKCVEGNTESHERTTRMLGRVEQAITKSNGGARASHV